MIRIIKKTLSVAPNILLTNGVFLKDALIARYNTGERAFTGDDFNKKIYAHTEVKEALIKCQNCKCCFCESTIGHIASGDVEHYRPKAGWIQGNEKLNKPGYYWLAYDWDNLLLCCEKCNREFKKNFFPLFNPSERALSHNANIADEQPILIHPVHENPSDHITFREEVPVAVNGNSKGSFTISRLGLDRELLNGQRRKTLNKVKVIYDLAKMIPNSPKDQKDEARKKISQYFDDSQNDDTEYALMLRCFFRDNPIDF